MQQKLLGQNEVMTTLAFVHINTMPFEQRQTTVVKLDSKGALRRPHESNNDVQSSVSTSELVRQRKNFPKERQLTSSQRLLYRNNGAKTIGYDMVTQFGLHPVELLELFSTLGNYFRWFHIDAAPLPVTNMANGARLLEITLSFIEYSLSKSVHLTPDIVEYDAGATSPLYDLIIGKQTLHDIGAVLDFKEKTIIIDGILLPMRNSNGKRRI